MIQSFIPTAQDKDSVPMRVSNPQEIPFESESGFLPKGIAPELLLQQVSNTVPFIFDSSWSEVPRLTDTLKRQLTASTIQMEPQERSVTPAPSLTIEESEKHHHDYFELCLVAHHTTVASFVPTDVDVHIRFKLWDPRLSTQTLSRMGELVLESYGWDTRPLSKRWLCSPRTGEVLTGHTGEWFSTAAAAYGALRKRNPDLSKEIASCILREIQREAEVWSDLKKAKDGLGILKASTLIAHNLGDLDRVIEQWNLPSDDILRKSAHKSGHFEKGTSTSTDPLKLAGEINKLFMADENHRHFALRAPRCLRKSAELLLDLGPFLDDWGKRIARHPALDFKEIGEIATALVEGWEKLAGPVGYARALAGILSSFPGGPQELSLYTPAKTARKLKAGPLYALTTVPKNRFEDQWKQFAFKFLRI